VSRPAITTLALRHGVDVYVALEDYEERAAIREYLGGMSRADAEQAAIGDVEAMIKARPFALAKEPVAEKPRRKAR